MRYAKRLIIIVIIVFLMAIGLKIPSGSTPALKDKNGQFMAGSIASLEKIQLGGMEQWVLIRGHNVSNPVLLWLHGGPGSSQMPIARYFNEELEKAYTVVHWDQRGAGKSNPPDFDESTMTFEQYLSDAHELTLFLKERFQQERIYLLGHSWGTQLGICLVHDYPEDYHAYITVSQVVKPLASHEIAYNWLQEQAASRGNHKDLVKLKELGFPPYLRHEHFLGLIRMIDDYGGGMDIKMGKLLGIALQAPEYNVCDYLAWLRGSNRGSGPMWNSSLAFNAYQEVPQLRVPVYFFVGRKDYNTPAELQEEYFNTLQALAGKKLEWFENSAHTPFMQEADKFNQELIKIQDEGGWN